MENLTADHIQRSYVPNPEPANLITDAELLGQFTTPQIMQYFFLKMPAVETRTLTLWAAELLKYLILVQFSPGRILFGRTSTISGTFGSCKPANMRSSARTCREAFPASLVQ